MLFFRCGSQLFPRVVRRFRGPRYTKKAIARNFCRQTYLHVHLLRFQSKSCYFQDSFCFYTLVRSVCVCLHIPVGKNFLQLFSRPQYPTTLPWQKLRSTPENPPSSGKISMERTLASLERTSVPPIPEFNWLAQETLYQHLSIEAGENFSNV